MIDREQLGLREITFQQYREACAYWDRHLKRKSPDSQRRGSALILEPLVYPDYKALISDFVQAPNARRISFKSAGKWEKKTIYELMDMYERSEVDVIDDMLQKIHRAGFLYTHFNGGGQDSNHEIGWEPCDDGIFTSDIALPGHLRDEYDWQPAEERYDNVYGQISGLWVPNKVAREILKPASASPPADQSSRPDLGQ